MTMRTDTPMRVAMSWIQEAFDETGDLTTSVDQALDRIFQSGYAEQVFRERGRAWLRDEWRRMQHSVRHRAISERATETCPVPRVHAVTEIAGSRESIMETLWQVDGQWIRLGDLTRPLCASMAEQYRAAAAANKRMADSFALLSERVPEGALVRDVLTEAELRSILGGE